MVAMSPATSGASTAGMRTFWMMVWKLTAFAPAAIRVAPTMPPMSACEELDGNPKYQVSRFQAMAPRRPAKTMGSVTAPALTMPVAMVAATERDRNAPTKFSTADMATAALGRSAPVEIDVAIALAESWKPLVKSKHNAKATTATSRTVLALTATRQAKSVPPINPARKSSTTVHQLFAESTRPTSDPLSDHPHRRGRGSIRARYAR